MNCSEVSETLDFDALSEQAGRLRAAGNFEAAASLGVKLAQLNPDLWSIFRDLAWDLGSTGNFFGAQLVMERALHEFPNQFWLVYSYVLQAYHWGENQEAERRIGRLLHFLVVSADKITNHELAKLYRLCGFIYQKSLLHEISASFFQKALSYEGSSGESRIDFEWQALYDRVIRQLSSDIDEKLITDIFDQKTDYKIYYINLKDAKTRKLQFEERFSRCYLDLHRVNAIDGRELPEDIVSMAVRSQHYTLLGTLGCFMSHVKVWETIVSEKIEHSLILEDDALPMTRFPRKFRNLNIPLNFDVCFANKRMEPVFELQGMNEIHAFTAIPMVDALAKKATFLKAPGGDGYFLSYKGAQKLLSLVRKQGYGGHVDWRIVAYGLSQHDSHRFPDDSPARSFAQRSHEVTQLQSYSLFPALVDVDKLVMSTRSAGDAAKPLPEA